MKPKLQLIWVKPSFHGFSISSPVFDHLQCGPFYNVNDVSVYLVDRGGRSFGSKECILHTCSSFWTRSGTFFTLQTFKLQRLGKKLQEKVSSSFFRSGPLSPSVYLGRHWHHSCDEMGLPPQSVFCILQMIKNWMVRRPGTRLGLNQPPVSYTVPIINYCNPFSCMLRTNEALACEKTWQHN